LVFPHYIPIQWQLFHCELGSRLCVSSLRRFGRLDTTCPPLCFDTEEDLKISTPKKSPYIKNTNPGTRQIPPFEETIWSV
jgi:hypothetical protein